MRRGGRPLGDQPRSAEISRDRPRSAGARLKPLVEVGVVVAVVSDPLVIPTHLLSAERHGGRAAPLRPPNEPSRQSRRAAERSGLAAGSHTVHHEPRLRSLAPSLLPATSCTPPSSAPIPPHRLQDGAWPAERAGKQESTAERGLASLLFCRGRRSCGGEGCCLASGCVCTRGGAAPKSSRRTSSTPFKCHAFSSGALRQSPA